MSYTEETRQTICPSCGKLNHIVVAYAGDYRANEREEAACFNCRAIVDREKCLAIFTGETADAALRSLRQMQNRA
jgi:RNA polymerase subunit RPABC4/transcription elongation factor Spt4